MPVTSGDARLEAAISRLDAIIEAARAMEARYQEQLRQVHPDQLLSARNLLHYQALRREDLTDLQADLNRLGLSRLGRAEEHVLASVFAVRHALCRLRGDDSEPLEPPFGFDAGRELLRQKTLDLLGEPRGVSSIGIMVTLPSEAAEEPERVREMLDSAMTCARINCSQDEPGTWRRMVDNVERARAELGVPCRVFMDLGGPKMRIGSIAPGPRVIRVRTPKDEFGRVIRPERMALIVDGTAPADMDDVPCLPVSPGFFDRIQPGYSVKLKDTRGKGREMRISELGSEVAYALCPKNVYLETGIELRLIDVTGREVTTGVVGELPALEQVFVMHVGDLLRIHKEDRFGEPAKWDERGELLVPAHVSCAFPDVLDDVEVGEPLMIDDGRIATVVREKDPDGILVEVTRAKPGGTRLKAHKGFNLPDSNVRLTGLTDQDVEHLAFVAANADAVNVSFVNEPDDVEDLCDCLDELGADELGVVLKIETKRGYRNLPGILLAAMERRRVGVMIARGDLAVEAGWTELAHVQEEIMWLCEAAHVPIVWATQVLEGLAKKGQPTRAEISDVAMAERAECVMLNKGPFIVEAIQTLDVIVGSMERYRRKKAPLLHALEFDLPDETEVGRTVGTRVSRFDTETT